MVVQLFVSTVIYEHLQENAQITTPEQKVEKSTASGRETSSEQGKSGANKIKQPPKDSNIKAVHP